MAGYYDKNKDYAAAIKKATSTAERNKLISERQNKIDAMNASGTNKKGYTNDIYKGSSGTISSKNNSGSSSKISSSGGKTSSSSYFDANKDYAAAIQNARTEAEKQQLIAERQNKLNWMNQTGQNKNDYTNDIYAGSKNNAVNANSGYFDANKDYAAAIAAERDPVKQAQLIQERQNKLNYLDATGQNNKGYTNSIYGSNGNNAVVSSAPAAKGVYQNRDAVLNNAALGKAQMEAATNAALAAMQTNATMQANMATQNAAIISPEYTQQAALGTAAADPVQQMAMQAHFARQKSNIDLAEIAGVYSGDESLSLPDQQILKQYQALWNQGKASGNQALMDAAHRKAEAIRDNYRYYPLANSNGYNLGENDIGFIRDMVVRGDELGNKYVDQYNGNSVTTIKYDKDGNFVNQHTGSIAGHDARVAKEMAQTNARLAAQERDNNTFAVRVGDAADANLSVGELAVKYGNPNNGKGQALYSDVAAAKRIANGQTGATELFGYFDPNMDYAAAIDTETDPTRRAELMQERQNKINYLNATGKNPNGYTNAIYGQVTQNTQNLLPGTQQQGETLLSGTGTAPFEYIGMTRDEIQDTYGNIAEQLAAQRNAYLQQTQAQIQAAQDTAGTEFDDIARQAYIAKRQGEVALPQQLAALGVSGGGSETANLKLQTNYQNNLNSNEQARQQMLKDYALQNLQAQIQANSDIAGYYADAQQNALSAWQTEQANHNSWNQWMANYQLQQQQYQNELAQQQYQNQLAAQQYQDELKQQQINLALQMGDYNKLAALGYDTTYLKRLQDAELEQLALDALYTKAQTAKMNGSVTSGSGGGKKDESDDDGGPEELQITNQDNGAAIYVPGLRWVSYSELDKMVNAGTVKEVVDGSKVTYKKVW